mmetsp:Transcript_47555/g.116537  ORF Transcript_47555/g.116537 Transcript_47555/m.116537 type:complete len:249 (-) Transcript_47555:612-1358(-)
MNSSSEFCTMRSVNMSSRNFLPVSLYGHADLIGTAPMAKYMLDTLRILNEYSFIVWCRRWSAHSLCFSKCVRRDEICEKNMLMSVMVSVMARSSRRKLMSGRRTAFSFSMWSALLAHSKPNTMANEMSTSAMKMEYEMKMRTVRANAVTRSAPGTCAFSRPLKANGLSWSTEFADFVWKPPRRSLNCTKPQKHRPNRCVSSTQNDIVMIHGSRCFSLYCAMYSSLSSKPGFWNGSSRVSAATRCDGST